MEDERTQTEQKLTELEKRVSRLQRGLNWVAFGFLFCVLVWTSFSVWSTWHLRQYVHFGGARILPGKMTVKGANGEISTRETKGARFQTTHLKGDLIIDGNLYVGTGENAGSLSVRGQGARTAFFLDGRFEDGQLIGYRREKGENVGCTIWAAGTEKYGDPASLIGELAGRIDDLQRQVADLDNR